MSLILLEAAAVEITALIHVLLERQQLLDFYIPPVMEGEREKKKKYRG